MAAKRLLDVSKEEQLAFLDSFDTVFCDVDGVLWEIGMDTIEGADEGIKALRNLKKKFYFVTNNSTAPLDLYMLRMKKYEVVKEEIIRPVNALIWYLKKINFQKEVYVIGFQALKDQIKEAGFKVVYDEIAPIGETAPDIIAKLNELRPDVGAVIVDVAVNMSYMGLQKCIEYITKKNAIFLAGACETRLPFRSSCLIGPSHFQKAVAEMSGTQPIVLSKPTQKFNDFLRDTIGPFDPKRILFIGDAVNTDMKFATEFGYQKLLPLTGDTTEEDLKNWKHDEKNKPDYVVDSVQDLATLVRNLGLDKPKL